MAWCGGHEMFVGESGDGAVGCAGGDVVGRGELDGGGKYCAIGELAAIDVVAEVVGDEEVGGWAFVVVRGWRWGIGLVVGARQREQAGQGDAGALVGFADPGGVVLEGGAAVDVAESSCDGVQVDAGGDEFGGVEVAQFVPAGGDAELAGQALVPPGDPGRLPRDESVCGGGRTRTRPRKGWCRPGSPVARGGGDRWSAWRWFWGQAGCAPLVAPAVDLSILGLLLGTRHLALTGASVEALRPARRLSIFATVATLGLNVADPVVAGEYVRAAFDAVGPLLLIGWSEVGPGLLQAISVTNSTVVGDTDRATMQFAATASDGGSRDAHQPGEEETERQNVPRVTRPRSLEVLLERARREDAAHRTAHQRPISAETLRVRLGVGAAHARRFVKIVRGEFEAQAGARTAGEV